MIPSLPASAKPAHRGVDRLRLGAVDRRVGVLTALGPVQHLVVDLRGRDRHGLALLGRRRLLQAAVFPTGGRVGAIHRRAGVAQDRSPNRSGPYGVGIRAGLLWLHLWITGLLRCGSRSTGHALGCTGDRRWIRSAVARRAGPRTTVRIRALTRAGTRARRVRSNRRSAACAPSMRAVRRSRRPSRVRRAPSRATSPTSTATTGCGWSGWRCCSSTTPARPNVVQEAFTGLHRHWAGLRDEAAAVAYLRTAVVNGSRSVLRRRRTARDYVPPHQVNARSAESLAMLSAEHQAVVDALGTLPRVSARCWCCATTAGCPRPRSPRPPASAGAP